MLGHSSREDTGPVHGVSSIDHLGIVHVLWDECFTKLGEPQPAVSVLIIPVEEQLDLILGGHDTHFIHQAIVELGQGQAASPHVVEDFERVEKIEVCVHT